MIVALLLGTALAGELVIDAKVPARVAVDGELAAEIYALGRLHLTVADGAHKVVVTVDGTPRALEVQVGARPVVVFVGRTGLTVDAGPAPVVATLGDATVRFVTPEGSRLLVQVDGRRVPVPPGGGVPVTLPVGEHTMSVRNADGTQVYARGTLVLRGTGDVVVQITEGRVPETSGEGVSFVADGG